MLTVVRDKLWQPSINGYPYRESPDFTVYQSHNGPGRTNVQEDWVTSEAMGIAGESLASQLVQLTFLCLKNIRHGTRILCMWAIPGPGAIYIGEGTNGHDFASYHTFLCPRACRA